ncbi:MAG: polyprenyl synthetase family protein [Acidobacteriota bacterium]|nr:polyprenyl synthetase family protein [Acidobacteriota bacterium]
MAGGKGVAGLPKGLEERRPEIEDALLAVLPAEGAEPAALVAAMRYGVLAGGKRMRPLLFLAGADSAGPERLPADALEAAAALELLHTYSLIHDDLPCMDDDSLRRGRATCHVVFGEATALLAGDALQTLGFELLATRPAGDSRAGRRSDAVARTARAIGVLGMAGGQALDLGATGVEIPAAERRAHLRRIHALKTGRLIRLSLELGALHVGADAERLRGVSRYGDALGLLFQIADDILDVTQTSETLGKTAGKDFAQEKLTYPSVFGLAGAFQERDLALASAREAARDLEGGSGLLAGLALFAAGRDR